MKKTYLQRDEKNGVELSRFGGDPKYTLYNGIEELSGGWLLETGGDPVTVETAPELEEIITKIINSSRTPWEPITPEDREYIADTLAAWGLR